MHYFFPNTWENFTGNSASPLNHFNTLDYQRTTHHTTNTTARIYHFGEGANNEKTTIFPVISLFCAHIPAIITIFARLFRNTTSI